MTKEKELKLTIKQEAFARAYVETGNASEAYRLAYDAARMKPEVIAVKASEFCAPGVHDLRGLHAPIPSGVD